VKEFKKKWEVGMRRWEVRKKRIDFNFGENG
jgi:hypothetical protein